MVHEVEHGLQVSELHTLQVQERMLVRILPENGSEEGRASRQDELVCLDLPGTTAESAVKEILLLPDLPEGKADVALKIIPAETKLLIFSHFPCQHKSELCLTFVYYEIFFSFFSCRSESSKFK